MLKGSFFWPLSRIGYSFHISIYRILQILLPITWPRLRAYQDIVTEAVLGPLTTFIKGHPLVRLRATT